MRLRARLNRLERAKPAARMPTLLASPSDAKRELAERELAELIDTLKARHEKIQRALASSDASERAWAAEQIRHL